MRMDDSLRLAGLTGNLTNVWGGVKNMQRATANDVGSIGPSTLGTLGSVATAIAPAFNGYGAATSAGTQQSGVPAWDAALQRAPAYRPGGINFGSR
jgi:hypothetical protein